MFTCAYCNVPTGPRVPLRLLTVKGEARPKEYVVNGFDPETEEEFTKVVMGSEITAEYKVCPSCAGVNVVPEPIPNYDTVKTLVSGLQAHGKRCKTHYVECKTCLTNERTYRSIPAPALSTALEPPKTLRAYVSFLTLAIDSVLKRVEDVGRGRQSKRGLANIDAGMIVVRPYIKGGMVA